mgnify:CR=1 FL=1
MTAAILRFSAGTLQTGEDWFSYLRDTFDALYATPEDSEDSEIPVQKRADRIYLWTWRWLENPFWHYEIAVAEERHPGHHRVDGLVAARGAAGLRDAGRREAVDGAGDGVFGRFVGHFQLSAISYRLSVGNQSSGQPRAQAR